MLKIIKPLKMPRASNPRFGDVSVLLERLLVEVVSENYRYFLHEYLTVALTTQSAPERECWPPLLASERQFSGLFANGLSKVCPVSRPEMAITRGPKDRLDEQTASKDPNGRIDFFASFGKRAIAIELKRVAIATAESSALKTLGNQWDTVTRQAKEALVYMRKTPREFPHAVAIGLLAVRVSQLETKAGPDEAIARATERIDEIVDKVQRLTKPDFLAVYVPPAEMRAIFGWGKSGTKHRVFPGVIFAVSVHVRNG